MLSASLDTFNEAFASWVYVMNMNMLPVDWPEMRGRFVSLCDPLKTLLLFINLRLVLHNIGTNVRIVGPREAEGRCVPLDINCLGCSSE